MTSCCTEDIEMAWATIRATRYRWPPKAPEQITPNELEPICDELHTEVLDVQEGREIVKV